MKRLALLIPLVLLIAACGAPESGTVTDKRFTEAHMEYWTSMQCVSYRADGTCTMSMPMEHEDWEPDKWELRLEQCKNEGDCKRGWREVTQSVYDDARTGYHYDSKTHVLAAQ
jgi:hypothetical protein